MATLVNYTCKRFIKLTPDDKFYHIYSDFVTSASCIPTGGHFACACVNPLNDNSVGASNLMAGNRKLARKVTVLLKAISLVL